jgi:flagellar protein FlgJ
MAAALGFDTHIQAATAAATANAKLSATSGKGPQSFSDKAHKQAVDFEATFLNSMFEHMFTDIKGDGPLGAGPGIGVWRSFLTNEYAKSVAKSGSVGIAAQVYKSLMAHQEAHAK